MTSKNRTFAELNANDISYDKLKISVDYSLGGTNWASGNFERRGIYCYLIPCHFDDQTGTISSTLMGNPRESGFKILLEELNRKSQRKIDAWFQKISPQADQIALLYAQDRNGELSELVKS